MQQNLEQIRAANALKTAEKTTKGAVAKLPAMILTNGLLATAAFANELKKGGGAKRPGMQAAINGAAEHLASRHLGLPLPPHCTTAQSLIDSLVKATSADLQRASTEALAFLGYVKRFAKSSGSADREES